MYGLILKTFKPREPILKNEIKELLKIKNDNTLNQTIFSMVKLGILNRFFNGVFYIPNADQRFSNLEPSLSDYIDKKYIQNYQGLRVGAFLAYKYKLTTQVSTSFNVLTKQVAKGTRSKSMFDGKLLLSYPKFKLTEKNYNYHEFLELIRAIKFSDYTYDKNLDMLQKIMKDLRLEAKQLEIYADYYQSNRLSYMFEYIEKLVGNESS